MADYSQLEQQYGLPSGLLSAVEQQESGGDPNAVSSAGAQGLFQFMPETAKQYGIDPLDPEQAADGAARMYADLSKKYKGDLPSMLAGYNWGQGNVDRKGLDKAPEETKNYITSITSKMKAAPATGKEYAAADNGIMSDATIDPNAPTKDPDNMSEAELDAVLAAHAAPVADKVDIPQKDPDNMSEAELDAVLASVGTTPPPSIAKPAKALSLEEQAQADGKNGVPFWQGASHAMGVPAARAGITRIPFGMLQAGSEGFGKAERYIGDTAKDMGYPEYAKGRYDKANQFDNAANIFKSTAAEESASAEANKKEAPIAATIANLVPQIGQVAAYGTSLPGILAAGATAGGVGPKLSADDLKKAGYDPANTTFDKAMNVLSYLPDKAVTAASNAAGIDPNSRFSQGARGALTAGEGYGIAKVAPVAAELPINAAKKVIAGADNIIGGLKNTEIKNIAGSSDDLRTNADQTYKAFRDAGASINSDGMDAITSKIDKDLAASGQMYERQHGGTMEVVQRIKDAAEKGDLTLEQLDQFRQDLGQVIRDNTKSKIDGGGLKADGAKAKIAQNALDDAVDGLTAKHITDPGAVGLLNDARSAWSQSRKFDTIRDIIDQGNGKMSVIKNGLNRLLNDKKRSAAFTTEERINLKNAAGYTTTEGVLAGLGKLGFDFGNLKTPQNVLPTLEVAGAAIGAPHTLPVVGAGTAANVISKAMSRGKINTLLSSIKDGSKPLQPPSPPSVPPAAQLQLPPPPVITPPPSAYATKQITHQPNLTSGETVVDPNGVARPATLNEGNNANAARTRANELGLTPDIRRAQVKQAVGDMWDKLSADEQAQIQAQTEAMWREHKVPVKDMIASAVKSAQDLTEAKEGRALPAVAQAMKDAGFKKGGLVEPKFSHRQWGEYVQKHGKKNGHTMKHRTDPKANAKAYATLAAANTMELKAKLGRHPSPREVEMAHYVGAHGVHRLLKAKNTEMPAHKMFPSEIVKDQRDLFFAKNKPYTVAYIRKAIT